MKYYLVKLILPVSMLAMFSPVQAAEVVATVNGKNITQSDYEQFIKQRMGNSTEVKQINRELVIQELVNREILLQEAKKQKLDKDKAIQAMIEMQTENILIKTMIDRSPAAKDVTDAELKKEYDEKVGKADVDEFKARHILLKTEQEAKDVIGKLQKGEDFEELAKKLSVGPSAKTGGDLGWFSSGQMVPAFSQAVAAMKKGTYSSTPVQTQFGWHVIKLEDSRKLEPPKFEDVKGQLQSYIQQQRLQAYLHDLRNKAKVVIK